MLDTTRALLAVLATSLLPACQFPEYDITEVELGAGGGGANGDAGAPAELPEDCRLFREGSKSYLACESILNFAEAEAVCESQGRQLVRIDSEAENDVVTDLARNLGPYVWLGAKQEGSAFQWLDGTVFYDDGEVPGAYSNLVLPASDHDSTLRCVQLENSGAWTAARCTDTQQFVCE